MKTKTDKAVSIIAQLYNMSEEDARRRRPEAVKRMARRSKAELIQLYRKSEAARISMGKPIGGSRLPKEDSKKAPYATLPMSEAETATLIRALINYRAWLRDRGHETNEDYRLCGLMLDHLNAL